MDVKNVLRESADHAKDTKLPEVEESSAWQAASMEEYHGPWSTWEQALNIGNNLLVVLFNQFFFRF